MNLTHYFSPLLVVVFVLQVHTSTFPISRISTSNLVEIQDEDGSFLPLCADSFSESLANRICKKQHFNHVTSFEITPLSTILSLNVYCATSRNCTQYLAFGCNNGVELHCSNVSQASKCPKSMYLFGQNKCLLISNLTVNSYEHGRAVCAQRNLTLVSFSSKNVTTQINGIIKILKRLKKLPLTETKLLTSAVRQGNKWVFESRVIYNNTVDKGDGRCLGLHVDELIAVDCSNGTFWPVCELNMAAHCIPPNGQYDGTLSTTRSGLACLQWNNPTAGQQTNLFPEQKLWEHNFCRNIGANRENPWCLVGVNTFQECDVPICSKNNSVGFAPFIGCATDEYRCGSSDQCVYTDYFCDYESDCQNGFDELNCPDFLREFALVGDYKLVDDINEIWTHIPHIQGCAQRCITAAEFRCESFSFDDNQRMCLLSGVSSNPAVIFENTESKYYKRNFANATLSYRVDPLTMTILIQKNGISAALCADTLNDTSIDILCEQFGFGQPLKALPSTSSGNHLEKSVWTVDCLRNSTCIAPETTPSNTNDVGRTCGSILRCSDCEPNEQFACRTTGFCIPATRVCDQFPDCADESDEEDCLDPKWRIIGTDGPNIGRVQIYQQSNWNDVCTDNLAENLTDVLCQVLDIGGKSTILPLFNQYTTSTTFRINCTDSVCFPTGIGKCTNGILNVKCVKNEAQCGVQMGAAAGKRRFRRIVNGFSTTPGAYPWTASLKYKLGQIHHCGASIISENHLITAAHCFQNDKTANDYVVVVGDWDSSVVEGTEQVFDVVSIEYYPFFEDIFQHDIAVIRVNRTIVFDDYVQPICLPPTGYKYEQGQTCTVTGWGSNGMAGVESVSQMQAASLPILDRDLCLRISTLYSAMSRTAFCAGYLSGGVDSCQGDSGGPFACSFQGHFYLVGIISWGDGCGVQPGIYTSVAPYLGWIRNVTNIQDF